MPAKEDIIASLLRELVHYKEIGDEENVAGVEAELRFQGFKPEPPAKRAETRLAGDVVLVKPEVEKRGPGRPRKDG